MASNRARIVAHAGRPAGSEMPLHLHLVLLHPLLQLHTCYMCMHLETRVSAQLVQVRDTVLQSFRLYQPVLTDISKQSLEVK
jgi:hypothetical protein